MASYNVHEAQRVSISNSEVLKSCLCSTRARATRGLTDPAQHTAVSFADITLLMIGDSTVFDDIVIGKIVALLEAEILRELCKADRKLRQDYRLHRATASKP
jgi:hypothetical protein